MQPDVPPRTSDGRLVFDGTQQAATQYAVASFGKRLGAYLIDTVIYLVVWFIVLIADVAIFGEESTAANVVLWVSIWVVYFAYHWVASVQARSLGMRILKLAIVDEQKTERIPSNRALKRAFMLTLGTTVLGFGLLNCLWDDRKQTWHDKFTNSYVVATG